MLNHLIQYFDLQSGYRQLVAEEQASAPHAPTLPQYLAVSVGVFIEPFSRDYIASGRWIKFLLAPQSNLLAALSVMDLHRSSRHS